jgi:hypothetical protein
METERTFIDDLIGLLKVLGIAMIIGLFSTLTNLNFKPEDKNSTITNLTVIDKQMQFDKTGTQYYIKVENESIKNLSIKVSNSEWNYLYKDRIINIKYNAKENQATKIDYIK